MRVSIWRADYWVAWNELGECCGGLLWVCLTCAWTWRFTIQFLHGFLRSSSFYCLLWWRLKGWPLVFRFIFYLNWAVDMFGWSITCWTFRFFFFKMSKERVIFLLGCALFGEWSILYLIERCKCIVWTPRAWFILLGKSSSWFRLLIIISLKPSCWSCNFNTRVLGCRIRHREYLLYCWILLLLLVEEVVIDIVIVDYIRYWLGSKQRSKLLWG